MEVWLGDRLRESVLREVPLYKEWAVLEANFCLCVCDKGFCMIFSIYGMLNTQAIMTNYFSLKREILCYTCKVLKTHGLMTTGE